jgi:hypothetical protein
MQEGEERGIKEWPEENKTSGRESRYSQTKIQPSQGQDAPVGKNCENNDIDKFFYSDSNFLNRNIFIFESV